VSHVLISTAVRLLLLLLLLLLVVDLL